MRTLLITCIIAACLTSFIEARQPGYPDRPVNRVYSAFEAKSLADGEVATAVIPIMYAKRWTIYWNITEASGPTSTKGVTFEFTNTKKFDAETKWVTSVESDVNTTYPTKWDVDGALRGEESGLFGIREFVFPPVSHVRMHWSNDSSEASTDTVRFFNQ